MTKNHQLRCAFCTNPADDRPGAPLCVQCWDRIAGEAPVIVRPHGDPLLWGFMRSLTFTDERRSFGGLVSRLVGPPAGTRLN
jgi:hypothetical protein